MRRIQRARNSTSARRDQRGGRNHCCSGGRPANLKNRSSSCRCLPDTNRRWSSSCHQQSIHLLVRPSSRSTPRLSERASRLGTSHGHRPRHTNCTSGHIPPKTAQDRMRRCQESRCCIQHLHRTQQQHQRLYLTTRNRSGSKGWHHHSRSSRSGGSLQTSTGRQSTPSHSRTLGGQFDR